MYRDQHLVEKIVRDLADKKENVSIESLSRQVPRGYVYDKDVALAQYDDQIKKNEKIEKKYGNNKN